jgi:hypothetical protein
LDSQNLKIILAFSLDDQAWIGALRSSYRSTGRDTASRPPRATRLRIGGRQFTIQGRVWEHDGATPVLRLYLSSGHAESDTVFGNFA